MAGATLPLVWLVQRPGLMAGATLPPPGPAQRPGSKARADLPVTSRHYRPRLARSQPLPTLPQPKNARDSDPARIAAGPLVARPGPARPGAPWRGPARRDRDVT